MKKIQNNTEDKQLNELLYRLYEDCMKFKREKGKKINCNTYITGNKIQDIHVLFLFDKT
jgi:hypothetical protein